jgi:hypothetical protein
VYPLAALVFFASVVSMLELIGLRTMLVATHIGWAGRMRDQ